MNRVYLIIFLCFLFSGSYSQDHLSVGFFGGTSQYLGDINKTHPYYKPSPSYGVGITSTHNKRYSLSVLLAHHGLKGSTADFEDVVPLPPSESPHDFTTRLLDLTASMEFNFLPYETYNIRKDNFTPFIFAGLGTNYFLSGEENQFPLIIPFGLGIKYNIFERFSVGIQWTAKKTFFDRMDGNVVNISETENGSIIHNNDWYHHAVFFISFHPFREKIYCPAYEEQ